MADAMSKEDSVRAAFEEWALLNGYLIKKDFEGNYDYHDTADAWFGYQAGIAHQSALLAAMQEKLDAATMGIKLWKDLLQTVTADGDALQSRLDAIEAQEVVAWIHAEWDELPNGMGMDQNAVLVFHKQDDTDMPLIIRPAPVTTEGEKK